MSKTRMRVAALAVLAFSLVSSACFQMRVISLTGDKALAPGATTQYKIDLFRMSDANDSNGYIFMLVGLDDLDFFSFSNWDLKANFGGPFGLGACGTANKYCADAALETLALTGTECSANGVSASDLAGSYDEWHLYRMTTRINSASYGFSQKFRMRLNVQREGGTDDDSLGNIVVFSGNWSDLDDQLDADSGELTCTAFYGGSIPFKP